MRRALLLLLLSLAAVNMSAQDTDNTWKLHFGVEWGYGHGIYSYRHINIISQEGYRINETAHEYFGKPKGQILAKIGYDIHEKVNMTLCAGWSGLSDACQAYPLLLRVSFSPKGLYNEGFFTYIDGGIGFRSEVEGYSRPVIPMFDGGEGYRLWLTPNFCLDVMLSLRAAFDSPLVKDPEGPGTVQKENIRHNVAEHYSINMSIALSF